MKATHPRCPRLGTLGQSTIEFALMIVLLMSVVFFVLQLALIFSLGNYVHYATFMSARALLSSQSTQADQIAAAKTSMDRMLGANRARFGFIGKSVNEAPPLDEVEGPDPQHYSTKRAYSWLQGVRYTFRSRLFRVPMAGLGSANSGPNASSSPSVNQMTLTSESWLGRDPSLQECQDYMNQAQSNGQNKIEVLDNGC